MRFIRDRRGYETTALVQSGRRRGRGQRILYWFRTPPGVRVGRAAIDEDAIHLLEQHNPDVQFDWTRILKQPASPEPQPEPREQKRTPPPRQRQEPARASIKPPSPEPMPAAVSSPVAEMESPQLIEDVEPETVIDQLSIGETDVPEVEAVHQDDLPPTAAAAYLGAEGLSRLRARYAEVLARISDRPLEEPVREELKARAERLNPDAWVTDDEVRQGLEQYEAVFESLRAVVGHPRRRRRRRG
ncbi:MAG TPA: hypothetical protein VH497_13760 [Vicinamibacterales bacterium]